MPYRGPGKRLDVPVAEDPTQLRAEPSLDAYGRARSRSLTLKRVYVRLLPLSRQTNRSQTGVS